MKHFKFTSVFFLAFLLTACATSPTGRSQLMLVSPDEAIEASKEAYLQTMSSLDAKGKIDTDPEVAERIKRITGRLIFQAIETHPNTRDWEWSVKVIDDPETVNAWCMAGGKMAIYTGLLNKVNPTDDELAQVMGHEISHALANHTAEKMSVAMASQAGLSALSIALSVTGYDFGGLSMTGAELAATTAIDLPNSRTAEMEADRMGIELAARAGYDPRSASTLWRKMGEAGGGSPPQFLSTHPSHGNRQETLSELAPQMMGYYKEKKEHPVYPL